MVKYFVGDQERITFSYESGTYGTPSGANNWIGLVQNHTPADNTNVQDVRYAGTDDRQVQQFLDGQKDYGNTLTFFPQDFKFMKYVLGSCVDGGSPSPYTHLYTPANNDDDSIEIGGLPLSSFTLNDERSVGVAGSNFNRKYKGCVVNTCTINASASNVPVTVDLNYIAQTVEYSSGAPAIISGTDTTRPYQWNDVSVRIPSGTQFNQITEVSMTFNNNVDAPHYVDGNETIGQPIPGNLDVSVNVTLNATAEVMKDLYDKYYQGGSTVNLMVGLAQSAGTEEAVFTFSGAKLVNMPTPGPAEGTHAYTLEFRSTAVDVIEYNDQQYHNFFSGPGF